MLLVQELLRVWHAAVPPQLRQLLLSLFDLKIVEAQAMDRAPEPEPEPEQPEPEPEP